MFRASTICGLFLCIFLASGTHINAQSVDDERFDARLQSLLKFDVPTIDVPRAYREKADFLFLDAREKEEFAVSHIPGSVHIGYTNFSMEKLSGTARDRPVIVYCSVGYRSEKIGKRLKEGGFTEVYNLYGSLFEWVNQGYEVVDAQGPVKEVHTYNKKWSRWLLNPEIKKVW